MTHFKATRDMFKYRAQRYVSIW